MPLYHAWFSTKKRHQFLEGDVEDTVKGQIRAVCEEKSIELIELETMWDHVHVLLRAEDKQGLSKAMNYIKGTSSRRTFEQLPELKLDIGMNNLWQHRYGWKVVPEEAGSQVARYIRTQKERPEKYE